MNCNLSSYPELVTVYTLIFYCVLYKYLLNLKLYILIKDDINYPLIIFI
jgi:hypothetical protein